MAGNQGVNKTLTSSHTEPSTLQCYILLDREGGGGERRRGGKEKGHSARDTGQALCQKFVDVEKRW